MPLVTPCTTKYVLASGMFFGNGRRPVVSGDLNDYAAYAAAARTNGSASARTNGSASATDVGAQP